MEPLGVGDYLTAHGRGRFSSHALEAGDPSRQHDNRLAAFATDTSTYSFATPEQGEARVEVTLLFRRAFVELMDQKGWDVPDMIMEQQIERIPVTRR